MADIAYARRTISRRPAIPRPLMIHVFRRDCWACRCCGRRTIFYPVMPLLGVIFPEHFPYHPKAHRHYQAPKDGSAATALGHAPPRSRNTQHQSPAHGISKELHEGACGKFCVICDNMTVIC